MKGAARAPALSLVGVTALGAALTAGFDIVLLARVRSGADHALRLAAVLPYIGVDGWYTLARSCGIAALVLAYLALGCWGTAQIAPAAAQRLVTAHRQLGLLSLVLAGAHALLPLGSVFAPYGGWTTVLVPWGQPAESLEAGAPTWETLGILSLYLGILTGPTFYLLPGRAWAFVHRASIAVYVLAAGHALLLGSDFLVRGPDRVAIIAAQAPLAGLLAVAAIRAERRVLALVLALTALAATGGAVACATGVALGGLSP